MIRLFIGLDVPILAPLRRVIDELSKMGPSVRPVRTDGLHITLRFLGDTDPEHGLAIGQAIDAAVGQGINAGWLSPFDLTLTHLGTFPQLRGASPRVVFAAPDDPGPLQQLSDEIDARLDTLRLPIPPRDQPFHPHVTLARIRRRRTPDRRVAACLKRLIGQAQEAGLGTVRLKAVKLIESRQGTHCPDYVARHQCVFRRASG